ncbi:ATP-binding protein [Pseudomonas sp. MF7453]|uniref:ATP-binding protein n=1 Tax=Pseudomonas sp. MF7453 TaxID=2797539 RepID=UPI0018E7D8AD|nr:ATP-binding protein [Pseudomonas sp. MF7453]MBJ2220619.1 response regulator [Pseudomonas sp. MF7453]
MKTGLCAVALWSLLIMLVPGVRAGPVELSAEQKQWIQTHPVLRVGVVEDLIPFEYMDAGVLHGRSSEYLQVVTAATGLQFTYLPGKTPAEREDMLLGGQVDLLSSYLRFRSEPTTKELQTLTYESTSPIIVTRVDSPDVFDIDQLQGKTVAIPDVTYYEQIFRRRGVKANLKKSASALEILTRVENGSADAAIASAMFLTPYLYQRFQGILEVSGVLGSQVLDVSIATRTDQVMLYSILEKVFASISVEQRNTLYGRWYQDLNLNIPSLPSIAAHYSHVLILGTLVLVSLCALVYRGQRQRHLAVLGEQEKTMFLAVMGHEIRSPMNAVLAAMELLGHTRLNQQQRHLANLANSGVNALARLLDDVLDRPGSVAKLPGLAFEAIDVSALVQGVVGLHRLRAREKNLSLNSHIQAQLPLLLLDSSRLTQIFHNLISNAIKFTDTGSIDIDVALATLPDGSPQLQIEVRDSGVGISEAMQAALFQPYAQARESSRRTGGTGLGLMICRQLVDLMHGTLTLTSEQGTGTTVTIHLPVSIGEQAPVLLAQAAPSTQPTTSGLQILVVEDTYANQEVLRAQISAFDCQPVIAADAAQAWLLFRETVYDLVLMDCDLPDEDGYGLVRRLRALEIQLGRARSPIIAISALTGDRHLQRCIEAGMDATLSKPIRLGQLSEVIERWCGVKLAAPSTSLMAPLLDLASINREMAGDLANLVKAVALCDRGSAQHVAHRLHGAALIMEWSALAQAAEYMERLLYGEHEWGAVHAQALQPLLQHWAALSGDTVLDVLQATRVQRTAR